MWLRNWFSFLNALFLSSTNAGIPVTNPSNDPAISYRNFSGQYTKLNIQDPYSFSYGVGSNFSRLLSPAKSIWNVGSAYNSTTADTFTLVFGEGDTPVTFEDYRIETPLTGFSLTEGNTARLENTTYENGVYKFKTQKTGILYSGSGATIKEIAINIVGFNTTYMPAMCVYREVLSTPITVESGDSLILELSVEGANFIPA